MAYADLHVHSHYSDGTLSPRQLAARARANGVRLLALCDHNLTRGTSEMEEAAREYGLSVLRGVEVDSLFEGVDYHILCYGASLSHPQLCALLQDARAKLDFMSVELLRRMRADFPCLSEEEYARFPHDTSRGGWKMLGYLLSKGITQTYDEGGRFYPLYGVGYAEAGFAPTQQVVRTIHDAGGVAILAHPGESIQPYDTAERFAARIEALLELGLDGVECHYAYHTPEMTQAALAVCQRRRCLITAGSDCHGAFGETDVGQTRTPIEQLVLGDLEKHILRP